MRPPSRANINLPLHSAVTSHPFSFLTSLSTRKLTVLVLALFLVLLTLRHTATHPTSSLLHLSSNGKLHLSPTLTPNAQGKAPRPPSKKPKTGARPKSRPLSSNSNIPKAFLGKDGTLFRTYLEHHFPLTNPSQPHIWLTLADGHWATTGTHALHTFVNRLNLERKAKGKKETALVVLCMDETCVRNAEERGMYAFGGFVWNRPEKILVSTWPKLAGLIEFLKERDAFFVDSDVSFKSDPYPHMEPYMKTHDLIAQENEAFDHFNTGWFWMRKGEKASEAWNEVFGMDLINVSRDQNNFNHVLGTTRHRHCDPADCYTPEGRYPLKNDFVANNGLRVHILDPGVFRSHHFEADLPSAMRHESVSLHMTCGDDAFVKVYVIKAQGFWTDVRGYYSAPPNLVTVDHMAGNRSEVSQLMKILLSAAHYTSRAVLPPSHATFTDLPPLSSSHKPTTPTRRIFSAFPLPHIENALGVQIVEPDYTEHASKVLLGASIEGKAEGQRGDDGWRGDMGMEERVRTVVGLGEVADLDMRQPRSLRALHSILTSSSFASARQIRLMNLDLPGTNWRHWTTPSKTLSNIRPCARIWDLPSCDNICRFEGGGERRVPVEEGWPSIEGVSEVEVELEDGWTLEESERELRAWREEDELLAKELEDGDEAMLREQREEDEEEEEEDGGRKV